MLAAFVTPITYQTKGEYDLAIADFSETIKAKPKDANVYINRSSAYWNKKEFDIAIADLTKAIELDPGSAAAYYRRGLVRKDRKKYDLAIADFQEAARLTKDPELVKVIMEEIKNLGG